MTNIEITSEIRENMNRVINILHLICQPGGFFSFERLRLTGLSRAEVKQAIEAMQADGYEIGEYTFGYGLSVKGSWTEWMWLDYQKAEEYALYELDAVRVLQEEQAAAVAEVKRQLGI